MPLAVVCVQMRRKLKAAEMKATSELRSKLRKEEQAELSALDARGANDKAKVRAPRSVI
jgi:hypothetical protein